MSTTTAFYFFFKERIAWRHILGRTWGVWAMIPLQMTVGFLGSWLTYSRLVRFWPLGSSLQTCWLAVGCLLLYRVVAGQWMALPRAVAPAVLAAGRAAELADALAVGVVGYALG